ncbi:MAG: type II toxin-antitoxin system RelE/ParE family toxin [Coriobacteriia bacterium]|nr:type II toxin-antitoxin system RelE/ParE family toxin [Coriobacteriia bacterium]
MARIVYSPAAQRKLDSVHDYISSTLHQPQAAQSVVAGILDRIGVLNLNPDIGPKLSSRINNIPKRFKDTRLLVCGEYVALCDHVDGVVKILIIYHCREDVYGRFFTEIEDF